MNISIQKVCKFACDEPNDKNVIGRESIFRAGHLIKFGLQPSDTGCEEMHFFTNLSCK